MNGGKDAINGSYRRFGYSLQNRGKKYYRTNICFYINMYIFDGKCCARKNGVFFYIGEKRIRYLNIEYIILLPEE
jgi:hypothetical protein